MKMTITISQFELEKMFRDTHNISSDIPIEIIFADSAKEHPQFLAYKESLHECNYPFDSSKKIPAIKALRSRINLSLLDSKEVIESTESKILAVLERYKTLVDFHNNSQKV